MGSKTRGLLEVLRVPLLASPLGDVLAGWLAAHAGANHGGDVLWDARLAWAGACGVALLAAGMAQNALVDAADDAARKPDRPMPRGDVSAGDVRAVFLGCLALAAAACWQVPGLIPPALAIVFGTAGYHFVSKRWRLAGCLNLGALRGADVLLGAAAANVGLGVSVWVLAGLYALYVVGASLHASTDDEGGAPRDSWRGLGAHPASPLGLATAALALLAGALTLASRPAPWLPTAIGLALLAWAGARLLSATRGGPPGRVTGAALGSLLLLTAAAAAGFGALTASLVLVLLMLASRRLLAWFPPS